MPFQLFFSNKIEILYISSNIWYFDLTMHIDKFSCHYVDWSSNIKTNLVFLEKFLVGHDILSFWCIYCRIALWIFKNCFYIYVHERDWFIIFLSSYPRQVVGSRLFWVCKHWACSDSPCLYVLEYFRGWIITVFFLDVGWIHQQSHHGQVFSLWECFLTDWMHRTIFINFLYIS